MIIKPRLFRKPNLSHPRARGLVGCWLMNEGSGSIVQDLSGNGNRGGFVADTHWVGGNTGQALSLDGTADYILLDRCASPASLPVTVIIKAKIGSVAAFQRLFHSCLSTGNTDLEGIYIQTTSGGKLEISFGNGGAAGVASRRTKTSATSVTTNWETYAGVIRGATDMSLYINGVDAGGTYDGTGNAYDPGSSPGGIGVLEYQINLYYLTGLVEYVYIYNRALSDSEISQLYREPFCMFDRDPIELWSAATQGEEAPVGNAGIMTTNTGYWGATY